MDFPSFCFCFLLFSSVFFCVWKFFKFSTCLIKLLIFLIVKYLHFEISSWKYFSKHSLCFWILLHATNQRLDYAAKLAKKVKHLESANNSDTSKPFALFLWKIFSTLSRQRNIIKIKFNLYATVCVHQIGKNFFQAPRETANEKNSEKSTWNRAR